MNALNTLIYQSVESADGRVRQRRARYVCKSPPMNLRGVHHLTDTDAAISGPSDEHSLGAVTPSLHVTPRVDSRYWSDKSISLTHSFLGPRILAREQSDPSKREMQQRFDHEGRRGEAE